MEKMEQIDRSLSKMDEVNDIRVCELPPMRVLVSTLPDGAGGIVDDMGDGLQKWCAARGIRGRPGMRECFSYFDGQLNTFVFLQRVPEDFNNDGPYAERRIPGGLEAVVSGERDHLVERHDAAMQWIARSDRYELDERDGEQRHPALCDWLTPQELHRRFDLEQQDIFLPIREKEPSVGE